MDALGTETEVETIHLNGDSDFGLHLLENNSGLKIRLLPNGSVYDIAHASIQINQVLAHPIQGGLAGIYLRRHRTDRVDSIRVVGLGSQSHFGIADNIPFWKGEWEDVHYVCTLELNKELAAWRWSVSVTPFGGEQTTLDAILVQDLGLAARNAVRTNEAYTCQYLDHVIADNRQRGKTVLTRQNLAQEGDCFPWVGHAAFPSAVAAMTDGYDFFGTSSRATDQPEALKNKILPTKKRQFEFGCAILQTDSVKCLAGETSTFGFVGLSLLDQKAATTSSDSNRCATLIGDWSTPSLDLSDEPCTTWSPAVSKTHRLHGRTPSESQLADWFPGDRRHEERIDGELLSFFASDDMHVVTRAKEVLVDRPHGNILRTGVNLLPSESDLCVTSWASGVFASHIAMGNTQFQKLFSVIRNGLDAARAGGLRIALEIDGSWVWLGVPSAFAMTRQYCHWIYHLDEMVVEVEVTASPNTPEIELKVQFLDGTPVPLMITADVVMGTNENDQPIEVTVDRDLGLFTLHPDSASLFGETAPNACFEWQAADVSAIKRMGGDELQTDLADRFGYPSLAMQSSAVDTFVCHIRGKRDLNIEDAFREEAVVEDDGRNLWDRVAKNLNIIRSEDRQISRINDCLKWFEHNAVIHLSSPHGLEQYAGGAWGVRDVSQGSIEFLLALGHDEAARQILLRLFSQQNFDKGNWPQWFMFDCYRTIRQMHCHGDIVVWPLKALAHYINRTGDASILGECVPYTDTDGTETDLDSILHHVQRALNHIQQECIPGTMLLSYGDGDWNDSLQPAHPDHRANMVSSWTVALVYQLLGELHEALIFAGHADENWVTALPSMQEEIQQQFNEYLIRDGSVGGFAVFHDEKNVPGLLLHPSDTLTGINHRLLPITRGVLSGIFDSSQARDFVSSIEQELFAADGARLMDRPPLYCGGLENVFRRAESAAAFSREIGLMYVHAHLRYAEVMAELGLGDDLLKALMMVNPIAIKDSVSSAEPRQANTYFSSSDASFLDRYEASERYEELIDGNVSVKGGWRLYSSGPGIYVSLAIEKMAGLSRHYGDLLIDPVIPFSLNGLEVQSQYYHWPIKVTYKFGVSSPKNSLCSPKSLTINGVSLDVSTLERVERHYRPGGLIVPRTTIEKIAAEDYLSVEVSL